MATYSLLWLPVVYYYYGYLQYAIPVIYYARLPVIYYARLPVIYYMATCSLPWVPACSLLWLPTVLWVFAVYTMPTYISLMLPVVYYGYL